MSEQQKSTEEDRETLRLLGRDTMSSAYGHPGRMVVLDMWPVDIEHTRRYLMTPGQALTLIRGLADAAQRALRETVA